MDVAYILARLRAIEESLDQEITAADPGDVGGTGGYQSGYYRGRVIAYQRSVAQVRRLRRDLAASTARAGG